MAARRQPDPQARWLSHAVVGAAAGAAVGRNAGAVGSVVAALTTILLHEALDAPVAGVLADLGV